MNNLLFLTIVLITSSSEVQVIYNKVSVDDYLNYKVGSVTKRSYSNSPEGLKILNKEVSAFKDGNSASQVFINISEAQDGGWLMSVAPNVTQVYGKKELDIFLATKKAKAMTDVLYVEFGQALEHKNVGRK